MKNSKLINRSMAALLALSFVVAACGDDATEAVAGAATDIAEEAGDAAEGAVDEAAEAMDDDSAEETVDEDTMAEDDAEMAEDAADDMADDATVGTIVDVASGNADFSVLVEAVVAADLVDALSADGELTVFAPTNAAFEAFLGDAGLTKEELLASPDLADILKYHVLGAKVDSAGALAAATAGDSVATLNGADVALSLDGESIKVGNATVVIADVPASNGVIHAVDQVIALP